MSFTAEDKHFLQDNFAGKKQLAALEEKVDRNHRVAAEAHNAILNYMGTQLAKKFDLQHLIKRVDQHEVDIKLLKAAWGNQ